MKIVLKEKTGVTTSKSDYSGLVLGAKIDSIQLEKDLRRICRISIDSLEQPENDEVH